MMKRKRGRPDIAAHPHDGLIKLAFSKRSHATGLLKAVLPRALVGFVAWKSLKLEKDSFIDPALRKRYADLLFTVRIRGEQAHIYVLLEHQREVEKLMMLRLLVYLGRIWERFARDEPSRTTIPPVVPVLIHHSSSGWTAETSFENLVAVPEPVREALLPYIPRFQARLVDLSPGHATAIADEWLTDFGKLVLWALSVAGDDVRFLAEIGRMQSAMAKACAAPDGREALRALLEYIAATHQRLRRVQIENTLLASAHEDKEKVLMNMLDELRLEGRAETLLDLLTARFGSVPAGARARIAAANEATLKRWSLRVLTESTLDAVLDSPAPKRTKKAAPASKAGRASRS